MIGIDACKGLPANAQWNATKSAEARQIRGGSLQRELRLVKSRIAFCMTYAVYISTQRIYLGTLTTKIADVNLATLHITTFDLDFIDQYTSAYFDRFKNLCSMRLNLKSLSVDPLYFSMRQILWHQPYCQGTESPLPIC